MNFKSLKTRNLNKTLIKQICYLKNSYWKWDLKKQINWFNQNVKKKDIHNILYINKLLVGYTLLRLRKVLINKKKFNYYYLDSMIIRKRFRRKKYGTIFMQYNNDIIKKKKLHSFLTTTYSNINFYKKNNWVVLKKKNFLILDHNPTWFKKKSEVYGMAFNLNLKKNCKLYYSLK